MLIQLIGQHHRDVIASVPAILDTKYHILFLQHRYQYRHSSSGVCIWQLEAQFTASSFAMDDLPDVNGRKLLCGAIYVPDLT